MQSRVWSGTFEEGKSASSKVISQLKPLPLRLLQVLFVLLGVCIVFPVLGLYTVKYIGLQNAIQVAESRLQFCFEKASTLKHWIRPSSSLVHNMSDTELFWRASFAPRVNGYPFERTPKIAFMFLTRGPLPIAPLWERFFKGNKGLYSVYVHSLPSYEPEFSPSSVFYQRQIPSQVAEWGMMSMCDAERRLLANALLDISNEWFILLSEACIPLQNFRSVYQYISRSRLSFISVFDDPGPCGRGRYSEKMSPEISIVQWRKGSQWFELDRKLAIDIIADEFYYPKFLQFCKPDCYVDEHYFPTMLSIQSPHVLANRSVTWVDWSRGGPHPATYGKDDISEEFFKKILEGEKCSYNDQPSSLCFLFARKFAPSALEPLLEHSTKFLGF